VEKSAHSFNPRDLRQSRQELRPVARHPAGDSKTAVGGVEGCVGFAGPRIIAAQLGRTILGRAARGCASWGARHAQGLGYRANRDGAHRQAHHGAHQKW
jgi:hypothetical protein